MPGTLFVGDGIVIEIQRPSAKDLKAAKLGAEAFRIYIYILLNFY